MKSVSINVPYVTRVEGHGNIVVNIENGKIEEMMLEITESPRFFEAMLRGRNYLEAPHLTCRICGICSVAHTSTSLKGIEDAIGLVPSEQTVLFRKLVFHIEQLQSHILHEYFLAAPDALGAPSVFPLVKSHPDVVMRALRLKRLANEASELLVGRHVHPCSMVVGGFTSIPSEAVFRTIREKLLAAEPDIDATVELFATLKFPDFERETEYISLKSDAEYAFYEGDLFSSDTGRHDVHDYRQVLEETVVDHSTAKHASANRDSYMVGAMARVNNNFESLTDQAKKAAAKLGFKAPCHNPFMINVAQIIEIVHCWEAAVETIDALLAKGLKDEKPAPAPKAGTGIAMTEAPRGLLMHEYTVGSDGVITGSNLIIPTNQNLANIENDFRAIVPQILDQSEDRIRLTLEMLVRAYDPCISCSTHLLEVKFV